MTIPVVPALSLIVSAPTFAGASEMLPECVNVKPLESMVPPVELICVALAMV